MNKKLLSLSLACAMMCSMGVTAFASEGSAKAIMVPQTEYIWKYKTKKIGTITQGDWKLCYDGKASPATRDGETTSASASTEYTHTFSGSFATTLIKDKVQAELGYSYGTGKGLQINKTSASLKKGEYVKAYYKATYEETKVTQEKYKRRYGWTQLTAGGQYTYIDETTNTNETSEVSSKKAILPTLKLEYWKGNTKLRSVALEKIEYYGYINGEYVLIEQVSSNEY